jgi:hypothetical protein
MARIEQLSHEKSEAAADCNQQIDALTQYYGQHEDMIGQETTAGQACFKGRPHHLAECMTHVQRAVHAISELTGEPEPDCETDMSACEHTATALKATEECVQEKIAKPSVGICAIDGLGQQCILALDEGTLCMPNGPELPACNRLVKLENEMSELATAYQESKRTAALRSQAAAERSQAAAAWAQAGATQRANQQQYMVTTPGQVPTFIQPIP